MVGRRMARKDVHVLILGTCEYATVPGKKTLLMGLCSRSWDGESFLNYLCGLKVISRVLKRESLSSSGWRETGLRKNGPWEAMLLALKNGGRNKEPRTWAASGSCKWEGNQFSLESRERKQPCWHLHFSLLTQVLGFLNQRTVR